MGRSSMIFEKTLKGENVVVTKMLLGLGLLLLFPPFAYHFVEAHRLAVVVN